MAPISLGVTRKTHLTPKDKYTRAHISKSEEIQIWGSNLTLEEIVADLVVKAFDVITGEETYSKTVEAAFKLPPNASTEMAAFPVPVKTPNKDQEVRTVVAAYLYTNGVQIARYVNWPEPLKYVHLQKPKQLRAELSADGKSVELSAEVPIKGVAVETEDENVEFEDNLVDVVPGEMVVLGVKGASKHTVLSTRYLGMI
jgi:beta-mannosidase